MIKTPPPACAGRLASSSTHLPWPSSLLYAATCRIRGVPFARQSGAQRGLPWLCALQAHRGRSGIMADAYGEWCAHVLPCSRVVLLLVLLVLISCLFFVLQTRQRGWTMVVMRAARGMRRPSCCQQASGKQVAQHQLDSSLQPQPAAALHVVQHGSSAVWPAGAATALQLAAAAAGVSAAPG